MLLYLYTSLSAKNEETLKKAHGNLEKLVEERTKQLEKAYNSLKKSEKRIAEAQKMFLQAGGSPCCFSSSKRRSFI